MLVTYAFEQRATCPSCSAPPGDILANLPFDEPPLDRYLRDFYDDRVDPAALSEGRYVLVDCGSCGLIYQKDVPGSALLAYVYDEAAPTDPNAARASRGLQTRRGYAFQVEEMLKYFAKPPSDIEVLDYGMGWGNWLQMAQAYGCRATGAELSATRAAAPAPGIEVLPHTDLPAERFHFINTEQVFEHLTNPATTATRLVRALRPGGILRISVPNGGDIRALLAEPDWTAPKCATRSLNAVAPLEHLNCFSHEALIRFAEGFDLRPMQYPVRQYLEPWERIRFAASALVHAVRRPKGTMLLFQRRT